MVPGRDDDDRVALGGQVAAAGRRVHPADPRAEREADDGQRRLAVRLEAVVEDLLEPGRDRQLVGERARPERRLAGRARRERRACRSPQSAVPAEVGERVPAEVALLRRQRHVGEIVGSPDRGGVDTVVTQEVAVGRDACSSGRGGRRAHPSPRRRRAAGRAASSGTRCTRRAPAGARLTALSSLTATVDLAAVCIYRSRGNGRDD